MKTINVMIVNDSGLIKKILSDIISSLPNIDVSITASDGKDALRKLDLKPIDVILLDLEMPHMDGLTFIEKMMEKIFIPIIIVSAYSQKDTMLISDCFERGAIDCIPTPNNDPVDWDNYKKNIHAKILDAVDITSKKKSPVKKSTLVNTEKISNQKSAEQVIVIGASTGGPRVIMKIISNLPRDIRAGILVVQHMSEKVSTIFIKHLNSNSDLIVKEAQEGDKIVNGVVFVAPSNYHMTITKSHRISLNQDPPRFNSRPSVNVMMLSASEVFGKMTVGVLLSGLGHDGAFGLRMIKKRGGITLAQDYESSKVFGMAKAAQSLMAVDKLHSPEIIIKKIIEAVS